MDLEEYLRKNRWTISEMGRQIEFARSHLSEVVMGHRMAGKRLVKAIVTFTNGEVTEKDLLKKYKDHLESKN